MGKGSGGPVTRKLGIGPELPPAYCLHFKSPFLLHSFPKVPVLGHSLLSPWRKAKHRPPGTTHSHRRQEGL